MKLPQTSTTPPFFFRLPPKKTSGAGSETAASRWPEKSQGNDPEGCPESTRWSRWRCGWDGVVVVVPIQPTVGNGGDCILKQNALNSGLGIIVI